MKIISSPANFIPALRFHWLTPFYDFFLKLTMPEIQIKKLLIREAGISDSSHVLDFGCGSATLSMMLKSANPLAQITGVDIDYLILKRAKRKLSRNRMDIDLVCYSGSTLPFPDHTFDRIVSCLVFHHIHGYQKPVILKEILRVLKPDGRLVIADFGKSELLHQRILFNIIRCLDGLDPTRANARGMLPRMVQAAGFQNVNLSKKIKTIFGEIQLLSGSR